MEQNKETTDNIPTADDIVNLINDLTIKYDSYNYGLPVGDEKELARMSQKIIEYRDLHLTKQAEVIAEKAEDHFNKIEIILKEMEEKIMNSENVFEIEVINKIHHKLMLLPNDKQSIINAGEEYKNSVK